jgi:hypothetical protein
VPGRASVVPNRAVLVPAQRARPVWPPIELRAVVGACHGSSSNDDYYETEGVYYLGKGFNMEKEDPWWCFQVHGSRVHIL